MSIRLERLGAERDRARRKRDEWESRYKELDQKYIEQENTEIHEMVRAESLTPEQLAELLKLAKTMAPNPVCLENVKKEEGERTERD